MPETVVIYDAADDLTADLGPNIGARLGVRPWPVTNTDELNSDLDGARQQGLRIDELYFVTHGHPGVLFFGNDYLSVQTLRSKFAGKGFENLFNPGALVHFVGCEVAKVVKDCEDWVLNSADPKCTVDGNGSMFLLTFAQIFLTKAGGSADGWTTTGYTAPALGGSEVYHPMGQHVYIYMKRGGSRWRFAVGSKVAPSVNQWWKVWSRGDHGEQEVYHYQFQPPYVYWFSEKQYLGRQEDVAYKHPAMAEQRGKFSTDSEWLYIDWFDKNGVPIANERWDMPLFDYHQTGVALDPHLGGHDLRARMLGYY